MLYFILIDLKVVCEKNSYLLSQYNMSIILIPVHDPRNQGVMYWNASLATKSREGKRRELHRKAMQKYLWTSLQYMHPDTIKCYFDEIHRIFIISYMFTYMKLPNIMCCISLPDQTHHSPVPRELLYQHSVGNNATLHILLLFWFYQIPLDIYFIWRGRSAYWSRLFNFLTLTHL